MQRALVILSAAVLSLAILLPAAAPVTAQDGPDMAARTRYDTFLIVLEIVAAESNLDPIAMAYTLNQEQTSLGQIVVDNGGDPDAVAAVLVDTLALDEDTAQGYLDAEFPLSVARFVFGDVGAPSPDSAMPSPTDLIVRLVLMIASESDLSLLDVRAQMDEGFTLREIAENAGLDADQIAEDLTLDIAANDERYSVEGVRAIEALDTLDTAVNMVMSTNQDDLLAQVRVNMLINLVIVGAIADYQGMTRLEVWLDLGASESYADYIARHDLDSAAIQEAAATRLSAELLRMAELGLLDEKDAETSAAAADIAIANMLAQSLRQSPVSMFE